MLNVQTYSKLCVVGLPGFIFVMVNFMCKLKALFWMGLTFKSVGFE